MSLDYSIASVLGRLVEWAQFPKYSLERRVDIFLTPFLAAFVGDRLGGRAEMVLPEFPLLAALRPGRASRPTNDDAGETKETAHTVNVDYLLRLTRPGGLRCWVLLELKTDPRSFDREQAMLYFVARDRKMVQLRKDIESVRDRSKFREKYEGLLGTLGPIQETDQSIEVAYLGPSSHADEVLAWRDDKDRPVDRYLGLSDFAALAPHRIPGEHWDLWGHVRELLRSIDRGVHGGRA